MTDWANVLFTMAIISLVISAILGIIFIFQNAYGFESKNATITIYKGEMGWCTFGNPKHTNPICNTLELKNNPELIDQFLQFLEYGMVKDD